MKEQVKAAATVQGFERRRYSRHRLMQKIHIWREDGSGETGIAFEISQGGMSAATTFALGLGEVVELSPVVGHLVRAVVRRRTGAMYGFEFIEMTAELREQLIEMCEKLPPFQSLADI